jgi:hypothetical protein
MQTPAGHRPQPGSRRYRRMQPGAHCLGNMPSGPVTSAGRPLSLSRVSPRRACMRRCGTASPWWRCRSAWSRSGRSQLGKQSTSGLWKPHPQRVPMLPIAASFIHALPCRRTWLLVWWRWAQASCSAGRTSRPAQPASACPWRSRRATVRDERDLGVCRVFRLAALPALREVPVQASHLCRRGRPTPLIRTSVGARSGPRARAARPWPDCPAFLRLALTRQLPQRLANVWSYTAAAQRLSRSLRGPALLGGGGGDGSETRPMERAAAKLEGVLAAHVPGGL